MTIHDERDVYIEHDPTPPMGTDLSAVQAAVAEPIEGELLTPAENAEIDRRQARTAIVRRLPALPERQVVKARATVTTKATVRHMCYPVQGAGIVWNRWRDSHGGNRYERMMRQAEISGNHDELLEWETRDVAEKQRRHERMMDWIKSPIELVKAAALGVAGVAGLLLIIGIVLAIGNENISDVITPITAIIDAIAFGVWFLGAYGAVLLLGGTTVGLVYLWHTGRVHAEPPARFAPAATGENVDGGRDVVPDEGAILSALDGLGFAPLCKAIKAGWRPRWVAPTTRVGRGWHTQLLLPQQVPVDEIAKRTATLAHNLMRKPIEVWPTEPKDQPGVLDLWVADQGILSGPVDEWPLLEEGTVDYFKGVPCAVDVRGEQVVGQLMARNYLIAGIMGSGKSSLVICLLLGAMLDPLVSIAVHVLAYNVDYDAMRPRLDSLVKGDDAEHIDAAMTTLRNLVAEVSERGRILEQLGGEEAKLTREIAAADPRMRPRVVVFDEVHELFTHKKHGEEAKELALKVTKKARKTGITMLWITPDADANSLPRGIAKTASNRVAFAINDHQGNDAILGTGMHKRGYTATSLVAGEDLGTAMAAGFAKTPGLIRSHYVRKEKGTDQITPVVRRAIALREDAGITTEPAPDTTASAEPDVLHDVLTVLGERSRMRTQEVLTGLSTLNPTAYGNWTFTSLKEALPESARPFKTDGTVKVVADRIREAITERNETRYRDDADDDTE